LIQDYKADIDRALWAMARTSNGIGRRPVAQCCDKNLGHFSETIKQHGAMMQSMVQLKIHWLAQVKNLR